MPCYQSLPLAPKDASAGTQNPPPRPPRRGPQWAGPPSKQTSDRQNITDGASAHFLISHTSLCQFFSFFSAGASLNGRKHGKVSDQVIGGRKHLCSFLLDHLADGPQLFHQSWGCHGREPIFLDFLLQACFCAAKFLVNRILLVVNKIVNLEG